ncbi:hypothetical protein ACIBHX_23810 [Nonomuraea sp. NPDC050536]|uniref:hypothetical protein n=1 Tax=Nonomuraea sp. NPDC050536 TaxID=3364366 RepID=UPI0037C6999F
MTVHDLAARFPDVADLRQRSKAMAMLDAILTDDFPCFRYDAHWGEGQEMASMNNGSGDGYSIVFTAEGSYQEYAAEYFEVDLPLAAIEHLYALRPLTAEIVAQLNPARALEDLQEAIDEIGYPR